MSEIVALKRVAQILAGQSPPSSEVQEFVGQGLPFLQGNAEFGKLSPTPRFRCDRSPKICKSGDILLSVRAPVGALNLADHSFGIGRGLCAIRASVGTDRQYLWWSLHARISELQSMAVGSTYAAVDVDSVGGLGVWLPTLALQRAIAQYLDAETARIDALIEKKRRMVELLEERLSSQVFAWITGHDRARADTRESNLGWVDRIADHWGTPPVSANFDLILGKMLNAAAVERGDQFPYLRNVNVQWDRIDFTDVASMHFNAEERRRFSLKRGDLLVCEGGEVGRAAVWQQGLENCYFQKAIHRLRPRNGTNARYLMYCLRAAADRGAFKVEGNTSTIVHLTGEQLRVHRFPWPPKDEQHEIVTKLDKASADHRRTVDVVTRQIDLLAERRSALITAAVTGELPIPGIAA